MERQILEKRLQKAKKSINSATGNNIIERCDKYLILLNKLRYELYKFRGNFEIDLRGLPLSERKEIELLRKEVRRELANAVQELNVTTVLLNRLTDSNCYDAVETLNTQNYGRHNDWEFIDGKIAFVGSKASEQLDIQEAVNIAISLRCEEFDLKKAA